MNGSYTSAGARLRFRDTGAGLPVVFLHPTPLDHDYWRPLLEDLGGIRAIVPDLRGHGASELGQNLPIGEFDRAPNSPVLTMAQLAADIIALLDDLEVPDATFVGCSIGGYVMLELWRTVPERIQAMSFICSKPQPDAESNLTKRAANIAQLQASGPSVFFDAAVHSSTGATARERHPALVAELRARMSLTAEAAIAVQAGLATRPDSMPTLATIDVPIQAIAGGEDSGITPAEMQAFNTVPGGCEFHLIPDAGHFAAYEQPQKVAALLAEWLRQPDA